MGDKEGLEIRLQKGANDLWGRARRDPQWRMDDNGTIVHKCGHTMRMGPLGRWQTIRVSRWQKLNEQAKAG
jgi:hypothetical protein